MMASPPPRDGFGKSSPHAAADGEAKFFVMVDFYFLEMSYLHGPISRLVLEMSYLPSRARFLTPHYLLYTVRHHTEHRRQSGRSTVRAVTAGRRLM